MIICYSLLSYFGLLNSYYANLTIRWWKLHFWCLLSPSPCVSHYIVTQSMLILNTILHVLWPYLLEEVEDGPEGCPALLLWQEGSFGWPSACGGVRMGAGSAGLCRWIWVMAAEAVFWILRLTDSLSPFILHPRSSLENLERCPSSLESGVFYCSFLAIWGLILDTAFCSLTPKLNPNSCTDLLYLYVDFDSSVSWVNCCLTSEWQWAWVFLSFGVCGGEMKLK